MLRHVVLKEILGVRFAVWMVAIALLLVFAMMGLLASPAHADTTFIVNSTADLADIDIADDLCDADAASGQLCTLRAAIQQANATTGADTIHFNIPTSDSHCDATTKICIISPDSRLPDITEQLTIDGYSQPDAHANSKAVGNDARLLIELNGANAGVANGLELDASNSVVRGLVIHDFDFTGISVEGDGNRIEGNFVGTDPSGTIDLGNNEFGVEIDSGTTNTIGGTSPEARNLISGNDFIGVFLSARSASSEVLGNYIGTTKDGKGGLGNTDSGVAIQGSASNTIGDGTAGGANTIAFNGADGLVIFNFLAPNDANGNRVLSNSIFSNGELGIDLSDDGRTANDKGDPDSGPNNLQNFPIITSAKSSSTKTTIVGKLNSTPGTSFKVQFFSNPTGNEGKKFIGQKSVTTNSLGNVSFTKEVDRVAVGKTITATATSAGGDTSEFSAPRTVVDS